MNIYDENKITQHEKARRFVNMKFQDQIGWAVPKQVRDPLNAYINQQEKKDERAKKVEELLNYILQKMFKENYYTEVKLLEQQKTLDYIRKITEEINVLDKELEETK